MYRGGGGDLQKCTKTWSVQKVTSAPLYVCKAGDKAELEKIAPEKGSSTNLFKQMQRNHQIVVRV